MLLPKAASNLKEEDEEGNTALHWSAYYGHRVIADLLLEYKANPNAQRYTDLMTPLMLAAKGGYNGIINSMCNARARVQSRTVSGQTALLFAAESGDMDSVRFLVDKGAKDEPSQTGRTALMAACQQGLTEMVSYLISRGGSQLGINSAMHNEGTTALMLASRYSSQTKVVELLLSSGAWSEQTDSNGRTALHHSCASVSSSLQTCQLLIQSNAKIIHITDEQQRTPAMVACMAGFLPKLQLLVNKNARLDVVDQLGNNCLHYAAQWGRVEVVRWLKDSSLVSLHARNTKGQIPMDVSARTARRPLFVNHSRSWAEQIEGIGTVDQLRALAADWEFVNQPDTQLVTAITKAIIADNQDVTQCLLESGKANYLIPNQWGFSALMYAKWLQSVDENEYPSSTIILTHAELNGAKLSRWEMTCLDKYQLIWRQHQQPVSLTLCPSQIRRVIARTNFRVPLKTRMSSGADKVCIISSNGSSAIFEFMKKKQFILQRGSNSDMETELSTTPKILCPTADIEDILADARFFLFNTLASGNIISEWKHIMALYLWLAAPDLPEHCNTALRDCMLYFQSAVINHKLESHLQAQLEQWAPLISHVLSALHSLSETSLTEAIRKHDRWSLLTPNLKDGPQYIYKACSNRCEPIVYGLRQPFTWGCLTSSTLDFTVAYNSLSKDNRGNVSGTLFIIKAHKGVFVSPFSHSPEEMEILFLPEDKFQLIQANQLDFSNLPDPDTIFNPTPNSQKLLINTLPSNSEVLEWKAIVLYLEQL
eukprot:NODE_724_length_2416_cov_8.752726_g621_i0.p1 GENE.NODE_724_length_2416_cov_8.752726_g621_i0~~NODE_724_length_2416_cov_8.752726_g621_i0.p1  ORF type:complete len:788 (+),score=165.14 NODE_724_length_2416_cov_8.752726_g621_i0:69-2366(+)